MNKKILNTYEIAVATHNIESIESALGHPIPGGMINYEDYSDHIMSLIEVEKAAYNIENITMLRNRKPEPVDSNKSVGIGGWILGGILGAAFLYVAVGLLYAVFSTIF